MVSGGFGWVRVVSCFINYLSVNVITHTSVGLKYLTETKLQILCDHVSHTRLHTVEMGCQVVQALSARIIGPTMCVNLTLAKQRAIIL